MTLMTRNGVSTTAKGEQYETFYSAHRGKKVSRVMYDYPRYRQQVVFLRRSHSRRVQTQA